MRTFLALELPENIKDILADLIEGAQNYCKQEIKWISRPNLHITLQFIGKTYPEDIKEIAAYTAQEFQKIGELEMHSPRLQIIPNRNPRLIWVSLQCENKQIFKISKRIKRKLEQLGYELDKKPFKLHITLGRVKKRLPKKIIDFLLTKDIKFSKFMVPELVLYRSYLKPTGAVYEKLVQIPKE
ncbi:MAG TPA: RNA 2',3'-cyclic phosphodiesterase [Candidatus Cloacimonas sp.]|nr:RNA 2',3'-cyclic phosphodiesterase [Candidatus Cloacimonas sp.]